MSASIASVLLEATPEQIVRAALTILEAQFEDQPDRLSRLTAAGNTPQKLTNAWKAILQECEDSEAAFGTFVQMIAEDLESGNANRP